MAPSSSMGKARIITTAETASAEPVCWNTQSVLARISSQRMALAMPPSSHTRR